MSKGKNVAVDLAAAVGMGMVVYLAGQLPLALLVVRGYLPEAQIRMAQMLLGAAGAFAGTVRAVRRIPWEALTTATIVALGMAVSTLLLGTVCWGALAAADDIAMRLLAMALGALAAGVITASGKGGGRKRRAGRKVKRKPGSKEIWRK